MNIYEPQGRAREYSPLALNYFKGCDNNCSYCYVPKMLNRFDSKYQHEKVIKNIDYKKIEKSAAKFRGIDKQILLSFTGDPYCNAEDGETAKVLEILLFYGHKVAILTKNPAKALNDIVLFRKFGNRFKIGSTLTFDNDKDSKEWEPGAELPFQRIAALKILAVLGIKIWASFEPVISPEQSLNMLTQVIPFIDHVKIGKINNHNGIDKTIDWSKFIKDSVNLLAYGEMQDRFYIKKDLLEFNKSTELSDNETNQDFLNL